MLSSYLLCSTSFPEFTTTQFQEIPCIFFEFLKTMCKASLHTWKINPFYFCMSTYMHTHLYNKYAYRDVAWPMVDIANREKRIWKMCSRTAHWQLLKIVVGHPSCPAHAGSGLEHGIWNEETANLCRRLLCPGHDKSFQPQQQVEDLRGLKIAGSTETKGFQEEENTHLRS